MKNLLIAANWKSNMTKGEARNWILKFPQDLNLEDIEIVIFPPFTLLDLLSSYIKINDLPFKIGAQDVSLHLAGAYTGEINASQIKEFAEYVLIGHSERRSNFSETDEIVNKKIGESLREGIKPIVCVSNIGQVRSLVPGNYIIAYEPISAIGTGNPEDPNTVLSIIKQIKEIKDTEVLYGGSVNPQNIKDYTSLDNISGVLVGNSSLDAELFLNLIKNAE